MPDSTLTGTAVAEVAALAREGAVPHRETVAGMQFTNRPLTRIKADPELPKAVDFATLTGFAGFLKETYAGSLTVHVVSPIEVRALGPLVGEDSNLRAIPATATCRSSGMQGYTIGAWFELELLNIALQTCFAPARGQIEALRKFCAAVRSTRSIGVADDGVSQTVEAKRGIAAVQMTDVGNPWSLAPWRTFAEIVQPESSFILRFQEDQGDGMQAALFATGDLSWYVTAVENIATYLRAQLGPEWTVLG